MPATSIYPLLYRESHRLFPVKPLADLFADIGQASIPPQIVAVVMVLQRLEGLSDREAVDRITFDLRRKYVVGGLDLDCAGLCTTCWSTCGHGCHGRNGPTGSSRSRWRWHVRRG